MIVFFGILGKINILKSTSPVSVFALVRWLASLKLHTWLAFGIGLLYLLTAEL